MANFSEDIIDSVWNKALIDPNNDPNVFRKDYAGAWIRRDQYGERETKYGWEIDHMKPLAKGGSDSIENLVPLHWKNNARKSDDYPQWETILSSDENKNVEKLKLWYMRQ